MESTHKGNKGKNRWKTTSRIFWGLFFLAAGVAIFLNQWGLFSFMELSLGDIIWTILLLVVIIKSLAHRFWFGTFLALFFLIMIYSELLGIPNSLSWWPILGAAIFLSIGFSILFKPKKNQWYYFAGNFDEKGSCSDDDRIKRSKKVDSETYDGKSGANTESNQSSSEYSADDSTEYYSSTNETGNGGVHSSSATSDDESEVYVKTSFGSSIKYVNSNNFKKAKVDCSFGSIKLYFDNAVIANGEAEIKIDASFCGIELFIPSEWQLIDDMDHMLGGVEEKNPQRMKSSGPKVRMSGQMKFSGIEIIYI